MTEIRGRKKILGLSKGDEALGSRYCFPYTLTMILNRLVGGCLAAVSFILVGLVISSRGSSTLGIEVMDRLGMVFVLLFLGAQLAICLIFLKRKDLLVPLLLFAGGTILYAVVIGVGDADRVPLHYALFTGTSFSGLASGLLLILGEGTSGAKD